MRYYYLVGDRPAALVQYDGCAQLLRDELGIEPMRETSNLYLAIKEECAVGTITEEQVDVREQTVGPMMIAEQDGLAELYDSATQLDEATVKLRRGISLVKEFIQRDH